MKKILNRYKTREFLTSNQIDTLKLIYGHEKSIPIYEDDMKYTKQQDSTKKISNYLYKAQEKSIIHHKIDLEPIINEKYIKEEPKNSKTIKDPIQEKYFFTDPFHKRWQDIGTVKNIIKEFKTFPFKNKNYFSEVELRFREEIASLVHRMERKGFLNDHKKSRFEAYDSMNYFVKKVFKLRKKTIEKLIFNEIIEKFKLKKELKKEFNIEDPIEVKTEEIKSPSISILDFEDPDRYLSDYIGHLVKEFPPSYQHDDELDMTNPKKRLNFFNNKFISLDFNNFIQPPAATVPVSPRDNSNNKLNLTIEIPDNNDFYKPNLKLLSKTAPVSPKLIKPEKKNFFKNQNINLESFWQHSDPLHNIRKESNSNHVKVLSNISSNLTFEIPLFDPKKIKIPLINENNNDFNNNNIKTNKSIRNFSSINDSLKIKDKPLTELETMQILNEASELDDGETGSQTHKKLNLIWDQLGFTVLEKLSMVVKYTEDPKESSKLGDALHFWNQALETVVHYDKDYSDIKNFIRYQKGQNENNSLLLEKMLKNLKYIEESLIRINNILFTSYGDEIRIRQSTLNNLISKRKLKIKNLISEEFISINLDLI